MLCYVGPHVSGTSLGQFCNTPFLWDVSLCLVSWSKGRSHTFVTDSYYDILIYTRLVLFLVGVIIALLHHRSQMTRPIGSMLPTARTFGWMAPLSPRCVACAVWLCRCRGRNSGRGLRSGLPPEASEDSCRACSPLVCVILWTACKCCESIGCCCSAMFTSFGL